MKKTAVVSCYFQHNYGSILQSYATQMILDKLGYDNETINTSGFDQEIKKAKMLYFMKAAVSSDILLSKIGMGKNVLIKRFSKGEYAALSKVRDREFDLFSKEYIRLSEIYDSKADLSENCNGKYDSVLVGSDQLWLPGNIAADYYTLNFVPDSVNTIAYATSFGQSFLPKSSAEKAKNFLKRIRHISVREEDGQKLVKKLVNRDVPIVCDPVLLFTGEDWLTIQQKESIVSEPYIFCYFLGNNPLHRNFVKKLRAQTGKNIVALTHLDEFVKDDDRYADAQPYNINPADFLNLIRNADYVCTDSFHCTAFSLLYEKIFFVFRRYTRRTVYSTNSRLDTLLKTAEVKGRILNGNEAVTEVINRHINFDHINDKLNTVREKSIKYLITSLKDERDTDL